MRRGRALVAFGGFVVGLVVATVSVHSHAAGRNARVDVSPDVLSSASTRSAELLPILAKHDTPALFGSFIEPGSPANALPSDDECPPDMVGVEGDYCPMVTQKCLRWIDSETKLQCAQFERPSVPTGVPISIAKSCALKTEHKRFCIDRYEWPNKIGAMPRYMATWNEARSSCESIGKRLCSDTEWTLACEGPERQPYPYGDGYIRDDRACNIDKRYIWPHAEMIFDPRKQDQELARLDQREASGSRKSCVSPYGVHDLVGNVDEWVVNESQFGKPYRSGLKGGYWGPVRTRCRPMTTAHEEDFRYYQIGFRCCGAAHAVEIREMPLVQGQDGDNRSSDFRDDGRVSSLAIF
ncbi:MAG: formylglycine-generating enzyme family protein [Myxococcota bacterium]|nr:formylglycine-generating enzyme family protein [Myxococcota bacterium]